MQRISSRLAVLVTTALALAFCGCAGKVETRRDPDQPEDQKEISTNATFRGSSSAALLDQGRQALSLGQYDRALEAFRSVSTDAGAKAEHRADALFGVGQVYSNVLNPKRDVDKALAAYQQIVADYPDSPRRAEAEQAITSLRAGSQ
jgi:outer membrane protein assembly factor BamD (BamD/ComL family)